MGKIQIRATYDDSRLKGSIRVFEIAKQVPAQYQSILFDNKKGVLSTFQTTSMASAIAKAAQFGFLTYKWSIEYLNT
jgi:hypothetical protein